MVRVGLIIFTLLLTALAACSGGKHQLRSRPDQVQPRIVHHVGAAHRCITISGGARYESAGAVLHVIDPVSGTALSKLPLNEPGESGPVVDLLLAGDRLLAVVEDSAVVEVDVADRRHPRIMARATAEELGLQPRRLSQVGDDQYLSGVGGVMRWSDRKRWLEGTDDVGRVVLAGSTLVASMGRRVVALETGAYLGAANDLQPWPLRGGPSDVFVFELRGEAGSTIGLMNSDIREITRVAISERVRRIRVLAECIWVVTDQAVTSYVVHSSRLTESARITIAGALDVARVDRNHLAVVGAFGRAVVWIENDLRGRGWLIDSVERQPWNLAQAWSDGRYVAMSDGEKAWLYSTEDGSVRALDRAGVSWSPLSREAAAVWGRAGIQSSERSLSILAHGATADWTPPDRARPLSVAAVNARLWVGTDRGINILEISRDGSGQPMIAQLHSLRIDGEVVFIFPLLSGERAAYVTRNGGVGVAEY